MALLGLTEIMEDQGDLLGRECLGVRRHATCLQGIAELTVTTDPKVEVVQGSAFGLRVGEVEHGKLGFAVRAFVHC